MAHTPRVRGVCVMRMYVVAGSMCAHVVGV